jgi:hypothetical protein
MKFLKYFLPDGDGEVPGGMGGEAGGGAPDVPQPEDGVNDPNGEGATVDEVAQILGRGNGPRVVPTAQTTAPTLEDEEEVNDDDSEDAGEGKPATGADDAGKAGEQSTETSTAAPDKPQTPPKEPGDAPATPEPAKAPDFSLTVEDASGQTYKLTAGDDIEKVLEDFEPKNAAQAMKLMADFQELEAKKADYDIEQEVKAADTARTERVQKIQDSWDGEIRELQAGKRLPTTADGKPSERVNQVFEFMGKQNEARIAKGLPTIDSFEDALDKMELQEIRETEAKAKADARTKAKENGAKIGGSSGANSTEPQAYKVSTGGVRPRNATQALRQRGILK